MPEMQVVRHATLATATNGVVEVIEDGAVAWHGDRIAWVGPDAEWDGEASEHDVAGRLVTPGYVDSHTHLIYAGDRAFELGLKLAGTSYLDILAQGGGIAHTSKATRAADLTTLTGAGVARATRMRHQGTTTLESKSGYALETAGELRMLEASAATAASMDMPMQHTFLGAHAIPAGTTADAYVDTLVDDMLPAVAKQGIASWCDAFVEKDVFTPDHARTIFAAAKKHDLKVRLHADELHDTGGAALAAEVGAVSGDHLLHANAEGIAAMAAAGTVATLLPTVPLTLMRPTWPSGRQFVDAGVTVALASDHNPNNPITSMSLVAQLGCYALGLTPTEALAGVTQHGAQALGMQDDVGSLEVGKRADILIHEVPSLDHWVLEIGRDTVARVVSGGRFVR